MRIAVLAKQIGNRVSIRRRRAASFRFAVRCLIATRHERTVAASAALTPPQMLDLNELAEFANASVRVQLTDRLAAAMLAIDEALAICELEHDASRDTSWIEPDLRHIYDQVNGILKTITN